ncbi:MAG: tetratricopeptide repeat protein [bacterium]
MKTDVEKLKKEVKKHGTNPQDFLRLGQKYLTRGDFKGARLKFRMALLYDPRLASKVALSYESLLDDDPENVNARLSLADLHLYLGEVEGAISELEEMLDIAPDRVDAYNILGKLYLKQGDVDNAIAVIEAAFRANVKDTNLTEMLAGAYIEKNRINDAISLYKNLVTMDRNNKNYLRILGELEGRVDMLDDAANSFYSMLDADTSCAPEVIYKLEDLKKKQPNNIHIKEVLADVYLKAVKPSLAVSELEEILSMDESRLDRVISKFRESLDRYPDEPSTLKALGKALTLKQEYSEAVEEYRKLMRYSGQYIDEAINGFKDVLLKFPRQMHAHESLGDAYLKLGRIEESLIEYLEVLKLDSGAARNIIEKCLKIAKENQNLILVHQVLGQAYIILGEGTPAIEEAEFMIYLDKNYAPAHQIMGDAYIKIGNPSKAQGSFISAMNIDPYNTILHKKYEEASVVLLKEEIERIKKRIDEDPWRLGAHLDIAKIYLMTRDFNKGIKELQVAVKDNARAPFAYNLLGLAFMELGRFDLAAIQFERALEVTPKELGDIAKSVRFNLGSSYEAMGNISGALAEYEMILSEDVEFAHLQARTRNLACINTESQRNKLIAAVIGQFSGSELIGMWGSDLRHDESAGDLLNISFGQEHNNAGFEHFIKGRFKGAVEEFGLAVQLDPKFCAALNNLAVLLMMDSSREQAETRLNLALSMDPGSAVIHNNLGIYHYLKKDLESAAQEFNKALEGDPSFSAAYINLGDIMYLKGSAQNAISLWEKVKTNDPLSPIAQRRLAYKTIKS